MWDTGWESGSSLCLLGAPLPEGPGSSRRKPGGEGQRGGVKEDLLPGRLKGVWEGSTHF